VLPKPPRWVPATDVRDVVVVDGEVRLSEVKFVRVFEPLLFHVPKIGRPLWK
jgi:hypothetical protein